LFRETERKHGFTTCCCAKTTEKHTTTSVLLNRLGVGVGKRKFQRTTTTIKSKGLLMHEKVFTSNFFHNFAYLFYFWKKVARELFHIKKRVMFSASLGVIGHLDTKGGSKGK